MDEGIQPPAADADVVERVRCGDVQAYGTLVERYERSVLAAACSVLRDAHAAQDVVQDVFVHCYLKLATLRDGSRFGRWLMKTAYREAIRASRRRKPTMTPVADVARSAPDLPNDYEHLLASVNRLPEHERVIVGLRYFDGHAVAKIAQMTGRPVGTVTKQLSRALGRLRGELAGDGSCPTNKSAIS